MIQELQVTAFCNSYPLLPEIEGRHPIGCHLIIILERDHAFWSFEDQNGSQVRVKFDHSLKSVHN
jgi:hypothetical protein